MAIYLQTDYKKNAKNLLFLSKNDHMIHNNYMEIFVFCKNVYKCKLKFLKRCVTEKVEEGIVDICTCKNFHLGSFSGCTERRVPLKRCVEVVVQIASVITLFNSAKNRLLHESLLFLRRNRLYYCSFN